MSEQPVSALAAIGSGVRTAAALSVAVVAGTVRAAGMVFARGRGLWNVLMARTRFDYAREVGDPLSNSIVASILGWVARNFPEAPIMLLRPDPATGEMRPVPRGGSSSTGGPFFLWLLEHPNPYYAGPLLQQATIVDYKATGNAYWFKKRNQAGRVVELWWLPSWMMEPRWDENDPGAFIDIYEYRVDGVSYALLPDEVVHFRNGLDPRNTRKGLGRLASLWRELFTDDEAANMTASLMRNLGVPGVIISPANTSNRVISDPKKVKETYLENFGGDERGGVMVQSIPTEVKVLSWSPEQMNLRELRRIPEERASAVLGVPAGVVGLGAGLDRNTFSNYGEANVAAYTQGIAPDQRLMDADIELQLLADFVDLDEGWDVQRDLSKASAMAAYFEGVHRRAKEAASAGLITRATFKKETGRPVDPNGADDVYAIANNWTFVPSVPGQPPAPAPLPSVGPGPLGLPGGAPPSGGASSNGHMPLPLIAAAATAGGTHG